MQYCSDYIPIDFIKAVVKGVDVEVFTQNPLLEFTEIVDKHGEVKCSIAEYYNLVIKVRRNNRIELSGSFHIFFNEGRHNFNDFDKHSFLWVTKHLAQTLKIEPHHLYILHLEWGLNINPNKPTNDILDHCCQHRSVMRTNRIDSIEGRYIQFEHSEYILKLYNKGLQYGAGKEIFRVEIKQINWSKYRKLGVKTLADFIEFPKELFINELITQWQSVVLYDIDETIEKLFIDYDRETFWKGLRNKSRTTFKRHFDKLKELNQTKGFDTQMIITEILLDKFRELRG